MPPTAAAAEGVASKEKCAGQAHEQQAAKQPQLPGRAGMRMHGVEALEKFCQWAGPKRWRRACAGVLLEAACVVYGKWKRSEADKKIWTKSDQQHDSTGVQRRGKPQPPHKVGAPGKSQKDEQRQGKGKQ